MCVIVCHADYLEREEVVKQDFDELRLTSFEAMIT